MARLNCLSARFAQHYYFIDLAANNDHKRNSYNDMERDLLANHTADWLFVSVLQCESLEAKWIRFIGKNGAIREENTLLKTKDYINLKTT